MKILVTGALGHIGSQLVRELPSHFDDLEVVMVDNMSTQRYCSLFNLPTTATYSFVETSIDDSDLDSLLEDVEAVVHLAALTDAAGTADKPELVHQNNFESTKKLADACLKHGVSLVFPSSTSVYGSQAEVVDEECGELSPQSPYADCKIKEEAYLRECFTKGLQGIICRLGTIYGTSSGMRFHTAVNKFCWQAVMNQPLSVWETALHQKRPYLALRDCCEAIIWIIKKELYGAGVYNIVSNNLTVQNVIDEIKTHKPSLNINLVQHKIMNQLSYEVSSDKFEETGFEFGGSLHNSIFETITLFNKINT